MNNILELARQAGFAVHAAPSINQKIQAFAALVRNAALEAAAVRNEEIAAELDKFGLLSEPGALRMAAKGIRQLKESGK